jgi:sulfide:quinone oxidoreductase
VKKLVILGHGTAGTIIDKDWRHHYQPGWIFLPFGIYTKEDCIKPKSKFVPSGVNLVLDEIVGIDPEKRLVKTNQDDVRLGVF